jgi:hypothetical protein
MLPFRSFTKTCFTVLLIVLVVLEYSCSAWRVQAKPPAEVLSDKNPKEVRLEFANNSKAVVHWPAIDGGNLVGWKTSNHKGPRTASYSLSDIQSIEVRGFPVRGRTLGLTAGIVAVLGATAAVVVGLAAKDSSAPAPPPPPPPSSNSKVSSCPLVYSDTGYGWRLDSGTFGGAIMKPLARTDVDNLDFVRPRKGVLRLKVANELDETDHLDAIEVLAVDHEIGTTVGPSPEGSIHALGSLVSPMSARDFEGRDVLASVGASDGQSWESRLAVRDPAADESLRDGIELDFQRPSNTASARLVVDAQNTPWSALLMGQFIQAHGTGTTAWYASMEAEPQRALQLQALIAGEAFLRVSVWNGREWENRGVFWEAGPEIMKRQVVSLDLAGIPGETLRVRLDAPASFWLVDFVGIDWGKEHSFSSQALTMQSAIDQKGRDLRDVLVSADGRDVQLETGDSIELHFSVPPVVQGKARSYVLRSTGWYKIHASEEDEPDLPLLNSVSVPGGIARISAIRMNAALEMLRVKDGAK